MSFQPEHRYSVAEYLALEESGREKHEYRQGEVFAMGGASEAHYLVVANVIAMLHGQLRAVRRAAYTPATCG